MRLSLKHALGTAPRKPLRERIDEARARLADTKVRAGKALAVAKIMMRPLPPPPAPVERIALINYATWLYHERMTVYRELYPEAGADAHRFIHADVAADRFHFPTRSEGSETAPASSRAVDLLDRLGIDWRGDRAGSSWSEEPNREGVSIAPVPHGWPRADAAILEALDDLTRLDAAQDAIYTAGNQDRDGDTVPGYSDLEEQRSAALGRLTDARAVSLDGLRAKAKALTARSVDQTGGEPFHAFAASLARDLLA